MLYKHSIRCYFDWDFADRLVLAAQSAFSGLKYKLLYFISNINSLIAILGLIIGDIIVGLPWFCHGSFKYIDTDERNFHIFYYISVGADKTKRDKFGVTKAQDYYYANQTTVIELAGVNSRYMHIEFKRASSTAGVTQPQIFNVVKLMSGILWLGNTDVTDTGNNANTNTNTNSNTNAKSQQQFQQKRDKLNTPKCQLKDLNASNCTALMLDVCPSDLASSIINKIRGETPLSVEEARNSRDTFAKQTKAKKEIKSRIEM